MKTIQQIILECVTRNCRMQAVLDAVYEKTGLGAILYGLGLGIILHTSGLASAGPVWRQAVTEGNVRALLSQIGRLPFSIRELFETRRSIMTDLSPPNPDRILFHPVIIDGAPECALLLKLPEGFDAETAEKAAELLAETYVYKALDRSGNTGAWTNVLDHLLTRSLLLSDGVFVDSLLTDYNLHAGLPNGRARPPISPPYAVAVLGPPDKRWAAHATDEIRSELQTRIRNCLSIVIGDNVYVFLFNLPRDMQEILDELGCIASSNGMLCGVSSPFSNLAERLHYKEQAQDAVIVGQATNGHSSVYLAENLYFEILVYNAVERQGLTFFQREEINLLKKHGAENHTDYMKTLETYLTCCNNLSQAASYLYLDRSTLRYRLLKIKSIMGIDFDEPTIARQLHAGILVNKYITFFESSDHK